MKIKTDKKSFFKFFLGVYAFLFFVMPFAIFTDIRNYSFSRFETMFNIGLELVILILLFIITTIAFIYLTIEQFFKYIKVKENVLKFKLDITKTTEIHLKDLASVYQENHIIKYNNKTKQVDEFSYIYSYVFIDTNGKKLKIPKDDYELKKVKQLVNYCQNINPSIENKLDTIVEYKKF